MPLTKSTKIFLGAVGAAGCALLAYLATTSDTCASGLPCSARISELDLPQRRTLCAWGVAQIEAGWAESFERSCRGHASWPNAVDVEWCLVHLQDSAASETVAEEEAEVRRVAADPCGAR